MTQNSKGKVTQVIGRGCLHLGIPMSEELKKAKPLPLGGVVQGVKTRSSSVRAMFLPPRKSNG